VEQRLQRRLEAALFLATQEELRATETKRWSKIGRRLNLSAAALILSDAVFALVVWGLACVLLSLWGWQPVLAAASAIVVWISLRALLGLYPGYGLNSAEELRRHTYALFAALAVLAVLAVGFRVGGMLLPRPLLVLTFLELLVLVPLVRCLAKWGLKEVGWWGKPVVILSYKDFGTNLVGLLREKWELGYDPIAIFDYRLEAAGEPFGVVNGRSALADAVDLARMHGADTAIFAMPHTRREQLSKLVSLASLSFRHVLVIPNLGRVTNSAVVARDLAGTFAVEIKYNLLDPWALRTKRVVDLVATVVGGQLILLLLFVLALLVYLESGWPVFYKDWRMGQDGKLFACVKFRTMVSDAEALLQRMLEENVGFRKEYYEYHKLRDDPRVTRIGRFLRRTSLDELPQLWNVLRGEMSLVGPRPYLPRESKDIGVTQSEILRVPPGITGPWQVAGRSHTTFNERVQMDAYYVHDWSIWLDIVLLARTARTLFIDRRAY
jgi:Undecaprenyl-phosphate galactose phosphotransferase WbaP